MLIMSFDVKSPTMTVRGGPRISSRGGRVFWGTKLELGTNLKEKEQISRQKVKNSFKKVYH